MKTLCAHEILISPKTNVIIDHHCCLWTNSFLFFSICLFHATRSGDWSICLFILLLFFFLFEAILYCRRQFSLTHESYYIEYELLSGAVQCSNSKWGIFRLELVWLFYNFFCFSGIFEGNNTQNDGRQQRVLSRKSPRNNNIHTYNWHQLTYTEAHNSHFMLPASTERYMTSRERYKQDNRSECMSESHREYIILIHEWWWWQCNAGQHNHNTPSIASDVAIQTNQQVMAWTYFVQSGLVELVAHTLTYGVWREILYYIYTCGRHTWRRARHFALVYVMALYLSLLLCRWTYRACDRTGERQCFVAVLVLRITCACMQRNTLKRSTPSTA